MNEPNSCIGIYNTPTDAEHGIKDLQMAGFEMKKLPILGKEYYPEKHAGFYHTGDRIKSCGKWGALGGGLWGLFFGWVFFWIPGFETLIAAWSPVSSILAGMEWGVTMGGLSALGSALYSMRIPEVCIVAYETAIKTRKFLLIDHGTQHQVTRAKEILAMQPGVHVEEQIAC